MPRFIRRGLDDFPRHQGYLKADPERIASWRERLDQMGSGLKVGIAWAGGVRKTRRALRSIPLERWRPVLQTPAVHFASLQYTADAGATVAALREQHGVRVEHWNEAISDYEETAALVCALDLVISVCTAVIHLGGALGRPVRVHRRYNALVPLCENLQTARIRRVGAGYLFCSGRTAAACRRPGGLKPRFPYPSRGPRTSSDHSGRGARRRHSKDGNDLKPSS